MTLLFPILLQMLVLVLIGYCLKHSGLWNESHQEGISNLLLYIVLPANILASSDCSLTYELGIGLLCTACFALVYYILALLLMHYVVRKFHLGNEQRRLFPLLAVFANTGFIGFPIVGQLFQEEGILYLSIYNLVFLLFFFSIGEALLTQKRPSSLFKAFRNPCIIASLIAIFLILTPIQLPHFFQNLFTQIGALMTPLSMFLIGASLVGIPFRKIFEDKTAYIITFVRQLLFPIVSLFLLCFLPLPNVMIKTCIITTALPAGTLTAVLAQKHHCDPQFASRAALQGTFLMLVTLPLILSFLEHLIPI